MVRVNQKRNIKKTTDENVEPNKNQKDVGHLVKKDDAAAKKAEQKKRFANAPVPPKIIKKTEYVEPKKNQKDVGHLVKEDDAAAKKAEQKKRFANAPVPPKIIKKTENVEPKKNQKDVGHLVKEDDAAAKKAEQKKRFANAPVPPRIIKKTENVEPKKNQKDVGHLVKEDDAAAKKAEQKKRFANAPVPPRIIKKTENVEPKKNQKDVGHLVKEDDAAAKKAEQKKRFANAPVPPRIIKKTENVEPKKNQKDVGHLVKEDDAAAKKAEQKKRFANAPVPPRIIKKTENVEPKKNQKDVGHLVKEDDAAAKKAEQKKRFANAPVPPRIIKKTENVEPKKNQKDVGHLVKEDDAAAKKAEQKKRFANAPVPPRIIKKTAAWRAQQRSASTSAPNPLQEQQQERRQSAPQVQQREQRQASPQQQVHQEADGFLKMNKVLAVITISDDENDGEVPKKSRKTDEEHVRDVVNNLVDAICGDRELIDIKDDGDDDITAYRPAKGDDFEPEFLAVKPVGFKSGLRFRRKRLTPEQEAARKKLLENQEQGLLDGDNAEEAVAAKKRKIEVITLDSSDDEDVPSTSTKKMNPKKQQSPKNQDQGEVATAQNISDDRKEASQIRRSAYNNSRSGLVEQEIYECLVDPDTRAKWYLVLWSGHNFTHCSYVKENDIKTKKLVQDFSVYEEGLKAIRKNLMAKLKIKNPKAFLKLFRQKWLPDPRLVYRLSDAQVRYLLIDDKFVAYIGYWRVKRLQIEWMQIIHQGGFQAPLYIENWCNDNLPSFKFINRNYAHEDAKIQWAKIDDDANAKHPGNMPCACIDPEEMPGTVEFKFSSNGETQWEDYRRGLNPVCYQCSEHCGCTGKCTKNFINKGRQIPLCVFYEPRIGGYGVRAVVPIKIGTFITEYVGEFITKEVAAERKNTYQFGVEGLFIDSSVMGNEARFVTHSCEPNVVAMTVYTAGKIPRLILVSKKDIKAGEELLLDYHCEFRVKKDTYGKRGKPSGSLLVCKCGHSKCRGWLLE